MKRFIITSEKFTGQVELLYKQNLLALIDYRNAKIDDVKIKALNKIIPVFEQDIKTAFASYSLTIIEAEIKVTLEDFKHEYPYARNMHLLPATWDKLPPTDKVLAVLAATEYRRYCERNSWINKKIANTWLKEKQYLNDWKNL